MREKGTLFAVCLRYLFVRHVCGVRKRRHHDAIAHGRTARGVVSQLSRLGWGGEAWISGSLCCTDKDMWDDRAWRRATSGHTHLLRWCQEVFVSIDCAYPGSCFRRGIRSSNSSSVHLCLGNRACSSEIHRRSPIRSTHIPVLVRVCVHVLILVLVRLRILAS